jgi:hypothetical protein
MGAKKKMRGRTGVRPRLNARIVLGGGPGQTFALKNRYFAATAVLTSMLSPVTVPVTVAFLPAC